MLPSHVYQGKHLDSFSSKKIAYNYLDKEIQEHIRSCFDMEKDFCGICYKCKQYEMFGIK